MLGFGLLAAIGYALWRAIEANRSETDVEWTPQPFPFPPQPRTERDARPDAGTDDAEPVWIASDGGACPTSHPVKVKEGSGIFHEPGGANYDRTNADRCYRDAKSAEADGFRASKV